MEEIEQTLYIKFVYYLPDIEVFDFNGESVTYLGNESGEFPEFIWLNMTGPPKMISDAQDRSLLGTYPFKYTVDVFEPNSINGKKIIKKLTTNFNVKVIPAAYIIETEIFEITPKGVIKLNFTHPLYVWPEPIPEDAYEIRVYGVGGNHTVYWTTLNLSENEFWI